MLGSHFSWLQKKKYRLVKLGYFLIRSILIQEILDYFQKKRKSLCGPLSYFRTGATILAVLSFAYIWLLSALANVS